MPWVTTRSKDASRVATCRSTAIEFYDYLAFAASALRCSALPIRHVTQIRQDQPEFLIAQVLFGKAGHPLLGPNPNRARISDQRAQTGIGEVLRRVHRQIQIGANRRRSCPVHRMACEAFVHEDGLPVSRRMERRKHGINRERGPPLGRRVLHRQTDNLVGPFHDWDG